jgi:large subunit ribosomal protein L15
MPLHRRLPKRGFTNIFKKQIAIINIGDLSGFESGNLIDPAELIRCGLVKGRVDGIKLLADGEIKNPLTIRLDRISKKAREKILAAGGSIEPENRNEA